MGKIWDKKYQIFVKKSVKNKRDNTIMKKLMNLYIFVLSSLNLIIQLWNGKYQLTKVQHMNVYNLIGNQLLEKERIYHDK